MNNTEKLANALVYDTAGVPVRLGTLWAQRPVVLALVRHFGCMLCRAQVTDLQRFEPQLRELHADLILVGPGTPAAAADFIKHDKVRVPVYADPDGRAFSAAGCVRGVRQALSLQALAATWRAFQQGFRVRGLQGDVWQLGGVWALGPGDVVHFAHVSRFVGDHPAPGAVLRTLYRNEAAQKRAANA